MKNKNVATIEMIDKRLVAQGDEMATMHALFEQYFNKPEGDLTRPSNEVALYLFKKALDIDFRVHMRPTWMATMLELGYLTFSELMSLEKNEKIASDRVLLYSLLYTKRFSFPETLEEMKAATSTLDSDVFQRLIHFLLRKEVDFRLTSQGFCNKEMWANLKKNYVKLMEKFFVYFAENTYFEERQIWSMCYYIPTSVITNRFKKALTLPLYKKVEDVFSLLARYGRNRMPFSQLVELIDYFKTLPFASNCFPYDQKCGMDFMLNNLSKYVEEISESDSALKCKLYNLFIRPLKVNPSILRNLELESSTLSSVIAISAALVPASELISFIETVLMPIETRKYQNKTKIIEEVACVRAQTKMSVPVEFIDMQDEYLIGESTICFNNDCINDVSFWLKREQRLRLKGRAGYSHGAFNSSLRYNSSFLNWFKPRTEDIPVYKNLYENYLMDMSAMSKVKNLTREFVKVFCGSLSLTSMHKDVLANVIDMEIISTAIESGGQNMLIPGELFRVNNSFDAAFFAKYAKDLNMMCNRGFLGDVPNIRLADVVNFLG